MTNDESELLELTAMFQNAAQPIEPSQKLASDIQNLGEPKRSNVRLLKTASAPSRFPLAALSAAAILVLVVASTMVITSRGGNDEIAANGPATADTPTVGEVDPATPPTTGQADPATTAGPDGDDDGSLLADGSTDTVEGPNGRTRFVDGSGLFVTPSGNIVCAIGDDVTCLISDKDWDVQTQDRPTGALADGCGDQTGNTIYMAGDSTPEFGCLNTVDRDRSDLIVVDYGEDIESDSVVCTSRESGLTCWNNGGGAFVMSRGEYPLAFARFWSTLFDAVQTDDTTTMQRLISYSEVNSLIVEPTPELLQRDFKSSIGDATRNESDPQRSVSVQNVLGSIPDGVTFGVLSEDSSDGFTTEHAESLLFELVDGEYKIGGVFYAG